MTEQADSVDRITPIGPEEPVVDFVDVLDPADTLEVTDDSVAEILSVKRQQSVVRRQVGRTVAAAGIVLSGLGVAAAVEGYTPHPKVDSSSTAALIAANKGLRDAGPFALAGGAVLFGAGILERRRNPGFKDLLRETNQHTGSRRSALGLTVVLMAATGAGSALGDAAASGANKPITALANAVNPGHAGETLFITQHEDALPFDHSEVSASSTAIVSADVKKAGGNAMPYDLMLGDVHRNGTSINQQPASSSIVLLPSKEIAEYYGVTLSSNKAGGDASCTEPSVIVNKQLGAHVGGVIDVEGTEAKVAKTINTYPGLGRAVAIGSLEQMTKCITTPDIYSGIAVSGISESKLQAIMKENGFPYAVNTYKQYEGEYTKFWDQSVMPPEMQLVGYVWLASLAGLGAIKINDALSRRHLIANLEGRGIQRSLLARAELLRAGTESVKAAYLAAIPMIGLIAVNASSQYGIAETFDEKALGAAFITGLAANAVGAVASSIYIRRMNTVNAERE